MLHKIVIRSLERMMDRRFKERHPSVELYGDDWRDYPNQRIGTEADPYLDRWFVVPKNDWPFGFLRRFMQHRWPSAPIWLHGAVGKFVDACCINIYLHHFHRSDDDRALHDHPWWFNISWVLDGSYDEVRFAKGTEPYIMPTSKRYALHTRKENAFEQIPRREGSLVFRWAASPHRVLLHPAFIQARTRRIPAGEKHVWTLFITGPYRATWGFYCDDERTWVHWKAFTENNAGCDQAS